VIFSYRDQTVGARTLVGMTGDIDAARAWTQQVKQFAQAQSAIVVPVATEDARRLQQLNAANQLAGTPAAVALPQASSGASAPLAQIAARHCTQCGAVLAVDSRFCARCGTPAAGSGHVDLAL
jgi:hypothetical protein